MWHLVSEPPVIRIICLPSSVKTWAHAPHTSDVSTAKGPHCVSWPAPHILGGFLCFSCSVHCPCLPCCHVLPNETLHRCLGTWCPILEFAQLAMGWWWSHISVCCLTGWGSRAPMLIGSVYRLDGARLQWGLPHHQVKAPKTKQVGHLAMLRTLLT